MRSHGTFSRLCASSSDCFCDLKVFVDCQIYMSCFKKIIGQGNLDPDNLSQHFHQQHENRILRGSCQFGVKLHIKIAPRAPLVLSDFSGFV